MADDDVQYEFKTVQTVRGTESRSIAKWQKLGWEYVEQNPGRVRTALHFRRPKPKTPWKLIAAATAFLTILIAAGGIATAVAGGDDENAKTQSPASASASETPSETPTDRISKTPSETPTTEPSASSQPGADGPITAQNDPQFEAVLVVNDNCDRSQKEFAMKHAGQDIEFDGSIEYMAKHGDYDTRYDILIGPGDKGPRTTTGPAFKFEDVNMFDLNLTGRHVPNYVGVGDRFHFVAKIDEYRPQQCLFFLDPVSTRSR